MSGPRTEPLVRQGSRFALSLVEVLFLIGIVVGVAMLVAAWIVLPLLRLFGIDVSPSLPA